MDGLASSQLRDQPRTAWFSPAKGYFEDGGHLFLASDIPSAGEYDVLVHESRLDDPHIQAFRSWVIDQAPAVQKWCVSPAPSAIDCFGSDNFASEEPTSRGRR